MIDGQPDAWEGDALLDGVQALNCQPFDALSYADERGGGNQLRQPDAASPPQLQRALAHTASTSLPPP